MRNRIARAIARGLGDDYGNAFTSKSEWNSLRGQKGGRYRDINEPFTSDYDEAADAVLAEMAEPTNEMALEGYSADASYLAGDGPEDVWRAMIKAASEPTL